MLTKYGLTLTLQKLEFPESSQQSHATFEWNRRSRKDEPEQRYNYMKFIRTSLSIPSTFSWIDANGEVADNGGNLESKQDCAVTEVQFHVEGVYDISGTTDVLLVPTIQLICPMSNIELLVELKKPSALLRLSGVMA